MLHANFQSNHLPLGELQTEVPTTVALQVLRHKQISQIARIEEIEDYVETEWSLMRSDRLNIEIIDRQTDNEIELNWKVNKR